MVNYLKTGIDPIYVPLALCLKIRRKECEAKNRIAKSIFYNTGKLLGSACSTLPLLTGVKPRFQWFSEKEAILASRQRNDLLDELYGKLKNRAKGSKLYTGSLSPGCIICQEGGWGCNFINRLCTRDCYFCKRSHRLLRKEPYPETDGFTFPNPSRHIEYLKRFQIKGVGFSGGEPLLVKDRLLSHLAAIRAEFGKSIYIWMYTNGDLVDRDVLKRLQDIGLDEIRFNIAAREYDLSPVVLARDYIPALTIEIPSIPEDHELLKGLLPAIKSAGVDFMNIHQLTVTEQNCREIVKRNYHFTGCYPEFSIYESEISALKLLLHACNNGIPINYCSSTYKHRFQGRGMRKRKAGAFLEGFQEITENGYIRQLSVSDSPGKLKNMIARIKDANHDSSLFKLALTKSRLIIHTSLIPYVDWSSSSLDICYMKPGAVETNHNNSAEKLDVKGDHKVAMITRGWKKPDFDAWNKLYIEQISEGVSAKSEELSKMAQYEQIDIGFLPV